MSRNSKSRSQRTATTGQNAARKARIALGLLLAANLVAAGLVLYPPGGSAEALEQQLVTLQAQVMQARARLERSRAQAESVERGRREGDQFLKQYFVARRELPSTLLAELNRMADQARIRDRGSAYSIEKIEGSETLNMLTISANFECTYRQLLDFVRQVDRAQSFLIIESLSAAPQPNSNLLTVAMKLDAFVRDDAMPLELASGKAAP